MEIRDSAHIGAARRAVNEFAGRMGFGDDELAELDVVVQEIGTNAIRHSTGGGMLYAGASIMQPETLELLYLDRGPGIHNIERAIKDGFSGGGGLGAGFGAMQRLTNSFEAYSITEENSRDRNTTRWSTHGTALLAGKNLANSTESVHHRSLSVGVMTRPYPGEEENGDAWFVKQKGGRTLLAVIDGLGHGHGASVAANAAVEVLEQWSGAPPEEVVAEVHDALKTTRGAVMGVAIRDVERNTLEYTGVGNIEARILGSESRSGPISTNGTVGLRLGKLKRTESEWNNATLILTSDGLTSSWSMDVYPDLMHHSPQLIAGVLMRDLARETDDATVLVAR